MFSHLKRAQKTESNQGIQEQDLNGKSDTNVWEQGSEASRWWAAAGAATVCSLHSPHSLQPHSDTQRPCDVYSCDLCAVHCFYLGSQLNTCCPSPSGKVLVMWGPHSLLGWLKSFFLCASKTLKRQITVTIQLAVTQPERELLEGRDCEYVIFGSLTVNMSSLVPDIIALHKRDTW